MVYFMDLATARNGRPYKILKTKTISAKYLVEVLVRGNSLMEEELLKSMVEWL